MFERFTEPARHVVVLAQEEARALKHNYIGTEHLLLGLLREWDGLAARVLNTLGVTIQEVRARVGEIIGHGDEITTGQIPFTPRGKKILELALKEARALGHNYIGTEHILLGIARENEGVASRILLELGADARTVRNAVLELLGDEDYDVSQQISPVPSGLRETEIVMRRPRPEERFWDRLVPWIGEHSTLIAGTTMFGVGLLVGWLIWG